MAVAVNAQLGPTNPSPRVWVQWDPNPEPDIGGYKIYYGTSSRIYDVVLDVGNVTNSIVTNLLHGTKYYFAATAYNTVPLESDFSDEVDVTTRALPSAPTGIGSTNMPVVLLSATLQQSEDPTGPWEQAAIYPTNTFDPGAASFFRVVMGIDFPQ